MVPTIATPWKVWAVYRAGYLSSADLTRDLSNLTVKGFTKQSEYFAHPFQTLGPINQSVQKEDSSPYKAFTTDLKHVQSKQGSFVWTVNGERHGS
jgi:hypothetical protein